MNRRQFLATAAAIAAVPAGTARLMAGASGDFEVTRTPEEWRALLTDAEYRVMRKEGTERAFTSPLDKLWEAGTYHCKGCDQALYSSEHKFDSGTGWPSFWQPLPNAVANKKDRKLIYVRLEEHCDRCGSHLGHVFDDGPAPTGKRHCINGISLVFRPADGGEPVVG